MKFRAALCLPLVLIMPRCDVPEYSNPPVYAIDYEPRFSPDGTKILFIRNFDDENPCGAYIMNSDGSGERFIDSRGTADWGPDGRTLAVRVGLSIWIVDADSGSPIKLVCEVDDLFGDIDWSPDGRWITYSVASANGGIVRVDVETGQTKLVAPLSARGARWSAESRRITYTAPGGVWVADSAGRNSRLVLGNSDYYGFYSACWLGDSIVCQYGYADGHEAAIGLAIADTNGHWRPLSINGGGPDAYVASGRIAYSAFLPNKEVGAVFTVSSDGSGRRQLTRR